MKKLSLWAKHHRVAAIALIIVIKILLASAAFFIGRSLLAMHIHIPLLTGLLAAILLLIAIFLYPSRSNERWSKSQFYIRQKSCDFAIALSSFVMIGTLVNANVILPNVTGAYASNTVAGNTPTAEEILASLQHRDKSSLTKKEKKILKQELRKQAKVYMKAKLSGDKKNAEKALYIMLTVIGAVGLLFVLATLCCSLSCSGAEGAAVVLAILGTAAIIWGAVALINRISRGPRRKVIIQKNDTST